MMANYSVDQGLGGENVASSFDDDVPYTPAWNEKVTGVPKEQVNSLAIRITCSLGTPVTFSFQAGV
jgi:nitrate reductase alpha subunit